MLVIKSIIPAIALGLLLMSASSGRSLTASYETAFTVQLARANNPQQAKQLFERAIQIARKIEDKPEKTRVLSDIAVHLAKARQSQRSKQLFDEAIKLGRSTSKYASEQYYEEEALRDTIVKIARSGQSQYAIQVARSLRSKLSKAEALNDITTVLLKTGQKDLAQKYLSESLKLAQSITEGENSAYVSNGSCANYKFAVLSKIAANLSLAAQLDRGLKVASQVESCSSGIGESGEDYQTWAYLGVLGHLGQVAQLQQTWQSVRAISSSLEKASVGSAIAVKSIEMGNKDLAVSIAQEIATKVPTLPDIPQSGSDLRGMGVKEKALSDIALKLVQVGAFTEARQVAQLLEKPLPQSETKALVEIAIAKKQENLQQLSKTLQLPEIPVPNESNSDAVRRVQYSLAKIVGALASAGQLDRAFQVSKSIQDEYIQSEALSQIVEGLVESGQIEQALEIAKTIPVNFAQVEALKTVVPHLNNTAKVDLALQIAQNIEVDGWQKEALGVVAPKFIELGNIDQGIQLARRSEQLEVLLAVTQQLAKIGKTELALQLVESIPEGAEKARAIASLAAG